MGLLIWWLLRAWVLVLFGNCTQLFCLSLGLRREKSKEM